MNILFTGGGTLGSVTPLLAVWERCAALGDQGLWLGTTRGIEREFVESAGLPFRSIQSGKLRRYFSIRNFFDPILLGIGTFQAIVHILRFKPDMIVNAGSFVGVPVLFAGFLLGKRCVILQLDIEPSLSNLLTATFAERIAVSCSEAGQAYPAGKTMVVGIPVRAVIRNQRHDRCALRKKYGMTDDHPILFVIGGGTGAAALNELVWSALPNLTQHMHVVHVTGTGKGPRQPIDTPRYHPYELLDSEYGELLSCADMVVSRAGMGSLSEFSCAGCATLLIPIPNSHQEKNALFAEKRGAARYCDQQHLTPKSFAAEINRMISREDERMHYKERMKALFEPHAEQVLCDLIHAEKNV